MRSDWHIELKEACWRCADATIKCRVCSLSFVYRWMLVRIAAQEDMKGALQFLLCRTIPYIHSTKTLKTENTMKTCVFLWVTWYAILTRLLQYLNVVPQKNRTHVHQERLHFRACTIRNKVVVFCFLSSGFCEDYLWSLSCVFFVLSSPQDI